MKIGVSGHQQRPNIDWKWVHSEVSRWLEQFEMPIEGWSSLAAGTDQLFAKCIIEKGQTHCAVIPFRNYDDVFDNLSARHEYQSLLERSVPIYLGLEHVDSDEAYLAAGKYIVDHADVMAFVWDGEPAHGVGGTADIFEYANKRGVRSVVFDPIRCEKKGDWA